MVFAKIGALNKVRAKTHLIYISSFTTTQTQHLFIGTNKEGIISILFNQALWCVLLCVLASSQKVYINSLQKHIPTYGYMLLRHSFTLNLNKPWSFREMSDWQLFEILYRIRESVTVNIGMINNPANQAPLFFKPCLFQLISNYKKETDCSLLAWKQYKPILMSLK